MHPKFPQLEHPKNKVFWSSNTFSAEFTFDFHVDILTMINEPGPLQLMSQQYTEWY